MSLPAVVLLTFVTGFALARQQSDAVGDPSGDGLPLDPAAFVVDTGVAYVRVNQERPSIAWGGNSFLAVWQDSRQTSTDIYGVRLSTEGVMLDLLYIPISIAGGAQSAPKVEFGASCYLVAWHDDRNSRDFDIYGARVAPSGALLDTAGIPISRASRIQEYVSVAAGDSCFLVVWEDSRNGSWDIYGARVDLSGRVLDPAGIPIGIGRGSQAYPDVAWNGTHFFVVWKNDQWGPYTAWGTRVNRAGEVLDPGGVLIGGDMSRGISANHPKVASDGAGFCVVWHSEQVSWSVYRRLVSAGGVPLGDMVAVSPMASGQQEAAIRFSGGRYLVAWEDNRVGSWQVYGTRLDASGSILDTPDLQLCRAANERHLPALAAGAGCWMAAWSDWRYDTSRPQVFGVRVDTSGSVCGASLQVGGTLPYFAGQSKPSVAAAENGYLLVWESRARAPAGADYANICGMRLDRNGACLDTVALNVTTRSRDELTPSVVAGDSSYLVAWLGGSSGIYAARVTRSGAVLDSGWMQVSTAGLDPAVAFDDTNFLVVWSRTGTAKGIYGARVTQGGAVLEPNGFTIEAQGYDALRPAVCFGDSQYLATWDNNTSIIGALIDPGGYIAARCPIISHTRRAGYSATAFDGTNFLVAWLDWDWERVWGARVSQDGRVLDTAAVQMSWGSYYDYPQNPAVAFDGTNYVVAWQSGYTREASIQGSIVTPDMLRTDSFEVTTPLAGLAAPALCRGLDGRVLLTFSGPAQGIGGCDTLTRIWGAFVGLPVGASEGRSDSVAAPAFAAQPNPFRGAATFVVPGDVGESAVRIRDAAGRSVRTIAGSGCSRLVWDGQDEAGSQVPPGIYFCELAGASSRTSVRVVRVE